ncbi:hypothetical protein L0Z72_16585 [candidate division KSB1 bacterium]|nr:hypothetical protein [candidate division KSB1 bacterium]
MRSLAHSTASFENAIIESIEGYDGYQSPTVRSMTDNRLRDYLKNSLQKIQQDLSRLEPKMSQYENHEYSETFQRLISGLKIIIQSMNNPSYNNANFFRRSNLNPGILSQIYDFDSHLVDQVAIFLDELAALNQSGDESEIGDILNHLFDLIDRVNQTMSEREFLILADE